MVGINAVIVHVLTTQYRRPQRTTLRIDHEVIRKIGSLFDQKLLHFWHKLKIMQRHIIYEYEDDVGMSRFSVRLWRGMVGRQWLRRIHSGSCTLGEAPAQYHKKSDPK